MTTVKVFYANGDTVITDINATPEQAEIYYVGKNFNIGGDIDNVQRCTKIEIVA